MVIIFLVRTFRFDEGRRTIDSPNDLVVRPLELPHRRIDGRGALFEKVLERHGQCHCTLCTLCIEI